MAMDKTIWKCTVLCMIFVPYTCTTNNFCDRIVHHTEEPKDWTSAMEMCETNRSKLLRPTANNIQQLSSCYENFSSSWVDKFQYLSSWIEIYGCYTWKKNALNGMTSTASHYIPAICERKCLESEFFGIKNDKCYCISENFKTNYLINTTSISCSTFCHLEPNVNCGGPKAINLYRRVSFTNFTHTSETGSERCSKLSCEPSKIGLYKSPCYVSLTVLCENGFINLTRNKNWTEQTRSCKNQGYIYKYTSDSTAFCSKTKISWSGVFRSIINGSYMHHSAISTSPEHPKTACYKLQNVNGAYVITSTKCSNELNYICIKDDNGDISSTPSQMPTASTNNPWTTWTTTEQSDVSVTSASETTIDIYTSTSVDSNTSISNSKSKSSAIGDAGIIVGVIVPTVVVLCIVVFIIIARKRGFILSGLKSKDEEIADKKLKSIDVGMNNAQNEEKENHIYTETVNPGYEFAKPMDNGSNQEYEIAKPFSNSKGLNGGPSRNDNEFAAVINDDDYVYTDTKEGEYDTFQNKEKRKIRVDEGNLYSHTTAGLGTDSDYDTTCGAKVNNTGDIYDNATVKQNGDSNFDVNPYDHI